MRLPSVCGLVVVLTALVARAEEPVWDPSADEGVPQDQLFDAADKGKTAPGARVSRKPVRGAEPAPAPEAAAEEEAEQPPPKPEEAEVARPNRRKPARAAPREDRGAEPEPAPVPEKPARASKGGGKDDAAFGTRRLQLFLVPVGSAATLAGGPVQAAFEEEIRRQPGFSPVDLVEALSVPPSAEDARKADEARRAVTDGNKQMLSHEYGEAANRFRRAVRLLESANDALDAWQYADAWARLGVALKLAGEDEAAREALRMAARADLSNQVDARQIDRNAGSALDGAREDVAGGETGSLSIVTSTPGARVFLGGVFRGVTPVTIDRVPVGLNLLRIDGAGLFPVVKLVEAKPADDIPVKVKVKFTPEALELQKTVTQLPRALGRSEGVPDMVAALGRRFKLERSVVATIEMAKTNVARVHACIFDFPRQARLADETADFNIDLEGGLEAAVGKWAAMVFDKSEGSRNRAAPDPLDRNDGTEAWYSTSTTRTKTIKARVEEEPVEEEKPEWERSNYKPETYRKKSEGSKDPLDHSDGTEGW